MKTLVEDAVVVENLSKTYLVGKGEPVHALGPVSFKIRRGEFLSLVGPSGCGKSTCLRIVDGVIEPDPGSEVTVLGQPLSGPGTDRARIFQGFALLPWKTVQGNVEVCLKFSGVPKGQRAEIARRYIDMVDLGPFADKYPHELSGGMQQRVAIARALAVEPEILLADEPFGSVDALTREILQGELLAIWRHSQRTVLFVTHSIDEAVFLSDRVLVMSPRPGTIVDEIVIDIPRPRDSSVRRLSEFGELRDRIWHTLTKGREQ